MLPTVVASVLSSPQPRFGLGEPAWLDPTLGASIFLVSVILAVVFHKLLFPLILRITSWTPTDFDSKLVQATRLPLTLGIVVLGSYLALTVPLGQRADVEVVARSLGIVLGVIAVASIIAKAQDWYVGKASARPGFALESRFLPLLRKSSSGLVYGLGALLVLDQLGINISPLIAGLGLGGLAVALAIQPTLSNLFAGTYVMTEGAVSTGDFIEMEGGISGYVVDVGWRSTRIRTWGNNLVVVPNSRFASTIITNYQRPVAAVNVYLTCGVSYDSDLHQVERVCLAVMEEELNSNPDAVKEYGSYFGFESFGDSNVDFWLFLQSTDRFASFRLKTSLMQRLHQRFKEENIVINYPVRTLQFPKGQFPEGWGGGTKGYRGSAPGAGGDGEGGDGAWTRMKSAAEKGESRGAEPLWRGSGGVPQTQFPPLPGQEGGREMLEKSFSATC